LIDLKKGVRFPIKDLKIKLLEILELIGFTQAGQMAPKLSQIPRYTKWRHLYEIFSIFETIS